MKAVVCPRYGPPEVLELREMEKPVPKDKEVLVKIHASTVTVGDCRVRGFRWAPWFWLPGRLIYGIRKPRRNIPGNELAGEIESAGKDVRTLKPGDRVFGYTSGILFGGTNAEYKCMREEGLAKINQTEISYVEAAAVPIGGVTALYILRKANIKSGQSVLIYGASGSVGTFAVQIAKYLGAEVTGVCSTANLELAKSLGADCVIDYTKEDFTKNGKAYDAIFDAVIKTSYSRCKNSLKKDGAYMTVDWPIFPALWNYLTGGRRIILGIAPYKNEDLVFLGQLLEDRKLKAVIDKRYPLEDISEAHRHVDEGHKKGNVVITS